MCHAVRWRTAPSARCRCFHLTVFSGGHDDWAAGTETKASDRDENRPEVAGKTKKEKQQRVINWKKYLLM